MKTIYQNLSSSQLRKRLFLFFLLKHPLLSSIGIRCTQFLIRIRFTALYWLFRKTVFPVFCGGETLDDCKSVIQKLSSTNISTVLDYSAEALSATPEDFASTVEFFKQIIDFASKQRDKIPFVVFKPTMIASVRLLEDLSLGKSLSKDQQSEFLQLKKHYKDICQKAYDSKVRLLIDAEESWLQDAADHLALEMMQLYNKGAEVWIYNTLQCYRTNRLSYLKQIHARATKDGFNIGIKLVRGAYLEKENRRALEQGYTTPIQPSKQHTDRCFDTVLSYILNHSSDIAVYIGTHNQLSCDKAIALMRELNLSNQDNRVWFGQLYGMGDLITDILAQKDYNISKYLPFGTVKQAMPYLLRRLQENSSVATQAHREFSLLREVLKSRSKISSS